jgi:hypothetical protein
MNEVVTEKKGMSKGCLVGLIVLGVLIVAIAALSFVCYLKKDSIMRFGVDAMVAEAKTQVANNPSTPIDSATFNAVADSFSTKLNAEEVDMQKMGVLAQVIQGIIEDKVVDSAEVIVFVDAMVDYYPELAAMVPEMPMTGADSIVIDSTVMDSSMIDSMPDTE